jgi:hypothetical protein
MRKATGRYVPTVTSDDSGTDLVKAAAEGTVSGAISALIEPVRGFLGKLLGSSVEQLGGWAGDIISFKRWQSRVRMLTKAQEIVEAAGLTADEVPLRVLMPILEGGANEERPEMQDLWATLLANAATVPGSIPVAFPEILRQLEPIEARALDYMISDEGAWSGTDRLLGAAVPGLDNGNIDNLVRLGLLRFEAEDFTGPGAEIRYPEPTLTTTVLAARFVAVCRPPAASSAV